MSIFSFFNKAKTRRAKAISSRSAPLDPEPPLEAHLGYRRLEERQVLSATFGFDMDLLTLNQFDAGQELSFEQDVFDFGGGNEDVYVFTVAAGVWAQDGMNLVEGTDFVNAGGVLTIATHIFGGGGIGTPLDANVAIDGADNIGIGQVGVLVQFESLQLTNLTTAGAIDLDVSGDVTLSGISAGTTIDITTTDGSINDANDDLAVDLTAGGLITLTATDEVGGNPAAMVVDPDGKLEFADGSVVDISSTTSGNIDIRGLGTITLDDVDTADGSLDVVSTDTEITGVVNVGAGVASFTNSSAGTMNLGTAVVGEYSLTDSELDGVTAGAFQFTSGNQNVLVNALTQNTDIEIIAGSGAVNFNTTASSFADLTVTSSDSIEQDVEVIVTGATNLAAAGIICLIDPLNDFIGEVTANGATVEFVDRNALTVGAITAINDIYLRSGATDSGALALNGNLSTTSLTGQVLLQSDSGATQAIGTVITTTELLVGGDLADEGTGIFSLLGANVVGVIATDIVGELHFASNASPFVFAGIPLNYTSDCGTTEAIARITANDKIHIVADGITINVQVVSTNVFLESTAGVTQGALGSILTTNLMVSGTGLFDLTNPANDTDNLAAEITGTLNFVDVDDVNIAELTCAFTGVAISGIDVSQNLTIDTSLNNGDITQDANAPVVAGGTTLLTAGDGDICLVDPTNDFVGEVAASGSTVELVDRNALTTGVIDAVDDIFLRSGATDSGALTLNGNLTTTSLMGQILLQSDSGATQANGTVITTSELLVGGDLADEGTGIFGLLGANVVGAIATDIVGELHFASSAAPFVFASNALNYISDCGTTEAITGITATDKIHIVADGITINDQIVSTNVFLESTAGVTQGALGAILTTNLMVSGTGLFDLTNPANDTDNLAAEITGTLNFVDVDDVNIAELTCAFTGVTISGVDVSIDLTIDTSLGNGNITQDANAPVIAGGTTLLTAGDGDICLIDPTNDFVGEVTASGLTVELVDRNALTTGVIDAVDDIFLRSGATDSGAITLNGNLTTTSPTGQILLQSDSGVTQAAGTVIATNELLLGGNLADEGSGDFVLTQANVVNFLAADLEDNLNFVDTSSLVIADLRYESACGTMEAICGLNVGGNLILNIDGSLTQTAAAIVLGTSSLTATQEICLAGGDCTGDGLNDNDFAGQVTATGTTVEIVDSNALVVGVITAADDIFLRSGDNGAGALTLNGNLTTTSPTGQILLQSDSGVTQAAGTAISTNELLLGGDLADEGSGNFVLTQSNSFNFLAADLVNNLNFVVTTSLEIGDLTYDSACGSMEAICGLNVGGNLVANVTGSLTQTAAIIVGGTSDLTATVIICLIGGDCTGDGLNDNDFGGQVNATAMTVEIVDSNALIAGNITAVDDIFLRSGDNGAGSLTLNGNLTTTSPTGQILLQSDSGATQAVGSVITTNELLLGGNLADEGSGNFVLNQANVVNFLAADLVNGLTFVDSTSLVIADLSYDSVCGTSEAICGLNVAGNLTLNVTGSLTQTAAVIVGGTSNLTATSFICFTGGDCTGDGLNDNDFVGQVTATGTTVEIVDVNDLIVGNITAVDDIFLRSGDIGAGSLNLNGDLTTSSANGQILLQSDSGATQSAGAVIATNQLLLGGVLADEGSGNFVLNQANVVNFLAANLVNDLTFVDSTSLVIADLTYDSVCGTTEAICGLNVGGDLTLNIGGSLTQTAAVIVLGTSSLTAVEEICLTGGDCTGDGLNDNDFVGQVAATATTVEIVDSNALTVGNIAAVDDIFLRSGDNGAGALTLNGNLTTSAPTGQILLQSDSGVTQAGGTVITTNELLLGGELTDEGSGNFVLDQANVVNFLAADLVNNLVFADTTSVVIADLTYNSVCNTTEAICGLNVGGDLVMDVTGSIAQTAAVIVGGTSNLTATVNICFIGGDCTGDGLNDNDFGGLVTATAATVEIVDANALTVGNIAAVDNIFLRSGDNGAGALTLNGNLTTTSPTGQILLQSDSGVTQVAGTAISTNELLLGGGLADQSSGNFVLNQANSVSFLAADLVNSLNFVDTTSLVIADLTYVSDCGTTEAICGLNVGGNLVMNVTGSLTQTAAVIVSGGADLSATTIICLTGGDCTGDGLNDNDFVGEITATAATVEIVDANGLTVGSITAVDDIFLRSGGNGVGSLRLNGNLTTSSANGQILLQSDSGVTQAAGAVITTNELLLGGDLADEGSGNFVLNQANVVNFMAGDLVNSLSFVDSTSLVIADLNYDSDCGTIEAICGLNVGGNLALNVTGSLTQTAAVIVSGTSDLTATVNICFRGGDCDGDGLNDNDFGGQVTATATTVEIVDSNTLIVGNISAVDDIFLRSGENGTGSLRLNGNLTTSAANGQVLLQSDSGVTQAVGTVITANELLLGGDLADEGSGNFVLNRDNVVDRLAAQLVNNLNFVNTTSIVIADLTYDSVCGTTEGICGLEVGGNLSLNIGGSLTQTASVIVQGTSSLAAAQEICLTGGDCTGDGLNDNDFVGQVTAAGTTVEIVDANGLIVGTVSAVDDIFLRSGDNGVGNLRLNGNLTTSAANGQVLLQSDSGVLQAGGVITTSQLLLGGISADEGAGNFVVNRANVVEQLAANLVNNLNFVNSTSLVIADLTYDSICGSTETVCGLNVGGNLVMSVTGSLTQTAAVIVGGTANLAATINICLTGGDCSGDGLNDNDFADQVTATARTVEIVDANALIVGNINAVNDIFLRSGDNGAGSLSLNGNLITSAVNGQVLLQSDSGVVQGIGSSITTNELLLGGSLPDEGSGNFVLNRTNAVDRLAADLVNNLDFFNFTSLEIAELSYESVCGTTEVIVGLSADNASLNVIGNGLDVLGNLTQTANIFINQNGIFVATDSIVLADDEALMLSVGQNASFDSPLIEVGQDGFVAAGAAGNVFFGSLTVNGGTATITEDGGDMQNGTELRGTNVLGGNLSLASFGNITNGENTELQATSAHAQFNSFGNVFLGNREGDNIQLNDVGIVANNAYLGLNGVDPTNLDGRAPSLDPTAFGESSSFGTLVQDILFIDSDVAITQVQRAGGPSSLNVGQLAINSDQYVHLSSIAARNTAVAITANSAAPVTDAVALQQLELLADPSRISATQVLVQDQSVSLVHEGTLNVSSVTAPTVVFEAGQGGTISGLTTPDGSIFISAVDQININENVEAADSDNEAQVTVYVSSPGATAANIDVSAEIRVNDSGNVGVVTDSQTFSFVMQPSSAVEAGEGTNFILVLNADGTADQSVQVMFGNPGEVGYRVGVIWDSQNSIGQPVENPNLFIPFFPDPLSPTNSENYPDFEAFLTFAFANLGVNVFDIDSVIANIFNKVEAFSQDAIINHQFDQNVFTTIVVRNDQNINLFVGDAATVDNSLNESVTTVRSQFDNFPEVSGLLPLPTIINPVVFQEPNEVEIEPSPIPIVTQTEPPAIIQDQGLEQLAYVRVVTDAEDVEKVGDELKLKDPSKELDEEGKPKQLEDVEQNQIEQIIEAIESDPDAEAGFWYKVYQQSGAKKELLFYHLKIGEIPQKDLGPESDFDVNKPTDDNGDVNPNPALDDTKLNDDQSESREPVEDQNFEPLYDSIPLMLVDQPRLDNDSVPTSGPQVSHSLGLTSGSLLLAGLVATKNKKANENWNENIAEACAQQSKLGFSRVDRVKRNLLRQLRRKVS